MGLEQVELVMDIEEEFGIEVPDVMFERVRSVADAAAVVIALLPKEPCPTAKGFYEFRRLLVEQIGIDRRSIRPGTTLDEIIPAKRRRVWNALRSKDTRLPRLVVKPGVDKLAIGLAVVVMILAVWVSIAIWDRFDTFVAVALIGLLIIGTSIAIGSFNRFFGSEFPEAIVTVSDVVRNIVLLNAGREGSGERLIAQQKVLETVRRLTAEVSGEPLEKVRPESEFIKDLGFG